MIPSVGAVQEIRDLRRKLRRHDHLYYVLNNPEISDREYDTLFERLRNLEEENPELVTPDSPTQRVSGRPIEGFRTVGHRIPMLSLDNTYSSGDVNDWMARVSKKISISEGYAVEEKIDGVGISLTYRNGILIRCATRGNGTEGDDVTQNIKTQKIIPLRLSGRDFPSLVEIRGEMFVALSEFKRINSRRIEEGRKLFANPRNTCAGTLKLLDPAKVAMRRLNAFFYAAGAWEGAVRPSTQAGLLDLFISWDLPVNNNFSVCKSSEEVFAECAKMSAERESRDYETDGAVIKINSLDEQEELGTTARSPRWAVAYKFEAKSALTRVKDIIYSVGRTGVITPAARFEPVKVGGVVISSATLHNFDQVDRLGIGIGDTVRIERGGDVIPKVLEVTEKASDPRNITPPERCPDCLGPVTREPEGVFYRCNNISCPAQIIQKIIHYASPGAVNIEGLGENVAAQLFREELVRDISGLYDLEMKDLLKLELFAEKRASNLLESIRRSRGASLQSYIFALGIPNVGRHTARVLAEIYGSIAKLMEADSGDLEKISEIGPVIAKSIRNFFDNPENVKILKRLRQHGVDPVFAQGSSGLQGKRFVFTGSLVRLGRKEAGSLVETRGGTAASSLSRDTDYLVAGSGAGSKLKKAEEYGVRVISEDVFFRMLESIENE